MNRGARLGDGQNLVHAAMVDRESSGGIRSKRSPGRETRRSLFGILQAQLSDDFLPQKLVVIVEDLDQAGTPGTSAGNSCRQLGVRKGADHLPFAFAGLHPKLVLFPLGYRLPSPRPPSDPAYAAAAASASIP